MDFTLTDDQEAIARLADTILGEQCAPSALRALEAGPQVFAAGAWKALAEADLLGLAVPEAHGGSGLGLVEAALVAEKVGRHVAPVPYWTSTAAALAVARWGDDAQRAERLPGVADGSAPLAVAAWGPAATSRSDGTPAVRAARTSGAGAAAGWAVHGTLGPVPWAGSAAALVVPAAADDGPGLFLVDPAGPGVTRTDERTLNLEPAQTLVLDGAPAERLGAAGDDAAGWAARRTRILLVATALGVCEGALALTAAYVSERQQFGSPIGTFQAVAHRCADAYVDTEAVRLTTLQALWRLDQDDDAAAGAEDAVAVAAFWATDGGHRVVHAAQHLHGGIGLDVDYPIHRYFRWEKVLEALLGGPRVALARLGASLAAGTGPG
ncbi:MAG TPA: acyl-CoA dehydrogenase family protein [Acidimicrobiales bacterium]